MRSDRRHLPDAVLIAGPTASGKSSLAIELAERLNGVVINADSMQVYADLRVLTARPSPGDEARVPHRLYGHVDAAEAYSAGRYIAEVALEIEHARMAGRLPVIVGGTGLYLKALLTGLSPIPSIPGDVRARWRLEASRRGGPALHETLRRLDPVMAGRLNPLDSQRIARALEVLEATGQSLSCWQAIPGAAVIEPNRSVRIVLTGGRPWLADRARERLAGMIQGGAVEEVRRLVSRRLDPALPVMGALGVRPLEAHIAGSISLEAAVEETARETASYIKRQMTWARSQLRDWTAVDVRSSAHVLARVEAVTREFIAGSMLMSG